MIYTFNQYYLTTHLTRKAARDIYLSYAVHKPEHKVLLKIYDAECSHPDMAPQDFRYRARKFKRLSHPHIVPILDIGVEVGQPYVVSDYCPGVSLRQQLERIAPEHFLLDTALALILDVGSALSYAHSQNILHQKVRPENVFLNAQGEALLADFSLHELINELVLDSKPDDRVISYMAPEQLAGNATTSSDQYALACLFYELVTGKLPFMARDLSYLWQRDTFPAPIPPSQFVATLPKQMERAILKALSKKPEERYPDVAAFAAALEEAVRPAPPAFPFKHLIPRTDHQPAVRITKEIPPPASTKAPARKEPKSDPLLPPIKGAARKEPESEPLLPLIRGVVRKEPESEPLLPPIRGVARKEPESEPLLPHIRGVARKGPESEPLLPPIRGAARKEPESGPLFPSIRGAARKEPESEPLFPAVRVGVRKGPESEPLLPAFRVAAPGQSPGQGGVKVSSPYQVGAASSPFLTEQSATSRRVADTNNAAQQAARRDEPVSSPGLAEEDDTLQSSALPMEWLQWLNDMATPSALSKEEVALPQRSLAEKETEQAQLSSEKKEADLSSSSSEEEAEFSEEEEFELAQFPFAEEEVEQAQIPFVEEEVKQAQQLADSLANLVEPPVEESHARELSIEESHTKDSEMAPHRTVAPKEQPRGGIRTLVGALSRLFRDGANAESRTPNKFVRQQVFSAVSENFPARTEAFAPRKDTFSSSRSDERKVKSTAAEPGPIPGRDVLPHPASDIS